jgi:hypothetical protein
MCVCVCVCVFCGDDAMPTIHKKLLNLVSLKFMNELLASRQVYTQHNLKTHFFFFFFFLRKKKQKQQEGKD